MRPISSSLLSICALLALSAPFAAGCSGEAAQVAADDGTDSSEDELRTFTLTERDNGRTVHINAGQSLTLKLASNPTTGFDWDVTRTDRTFGYPKESFSASSGAVGSGGTKKMVWSTRGPLDMRGTHQVTLEYHRSWETSTPPAKTFHFTVIVK